MIKLFTIGLLVSFTMATPAATVYAATVITVSNTATITSTTSATANTGGNTGGTVTTGNRTTRAFSYNFCPSSCTIISSVRR